MRPYLIISLLSSFPWKPAWGKLYIMRSNFRILRSVWSFILVASTPNKRDAPSFSKASKFDFAFLYIFIRTSSLRLCQKTSCPKNSIPHKTERLQLNLKICILNSTKTKPQLNKWNIHKCDNSPNIEYNNLQILNLHILLPKMKMTFQFQSIIEVRTLVNFDIWKVQ